MITVKLPDGGTAQFPDGMDPAQIEAVLQQQFGGGQAAPSGITQLQGKVSDLPSRQPQPPQLLAPDLMTSTAATVSGLVNSVPFLQNISDAVIGTGAQLTGGDYGQTVEGLRAKREQIAQSAPIARMAGELGGAIALPVGIGATKAGASALGMAADQTLGRNVVNSGLSMAGLSGLNSFSQGNQGGEVLGDMAIGAAGGALAPVAGAAVQKAGSGIANAVTGAAQRRLTNEAIKGAPTGDALRNAGSQLFEASTGGTAPAVVPASYDRFMSKIQGALAKFRPNAANDPQAVGLLQHLEALRAAANTPGTVLDFKDLHLARQLAQKVLKSPSGRDTAIAKIVVNQIDDFITTLKPADILGAADPTQAANDLMKGISTWARAERVGLIEQALKDADTYKSGLANGIKLSFEKLRKSADFAKFSPAEQAAIRQAAKGTTTQNIAELFGKLGFSLGGSAAHNIVGGSLGTAGLTTLLTPALGPAAMPVAFAATTAAGAAGRNISERLAVRGVDRAAQIAATPNIPIAPQAPNLLAPARLPIEILVRGGAGTSGN
jgi:hypothetical protein